MLHMTENPEHVRRRGRWLSSSIMEIYLQEILAATLVPQLAGPARSLVEQLAQAFPAVLQKARFLEAFCISRRAWYYSYLFVGQQTALASRLWKEVISGSGWNGVANRRGV